MMNDEDSASVREGALIASRYAQEAAEMDVAGADERRAPSYMYRPRLFIDGNKWCALYGENLQDGVAGFGDSPALAYSDFDRAWLASLPKAEGGR